MSRPPGRRRLRAAWRSWTRARSKQFRGRRFARNFSAAAVNVRFHPGARAELRAARSWYEKRSPVSAATFANEVSRAIGQILNSPNRYPTAEHGTRLLVLPRFPFKIFYRVGA